MRKLFLGLPVFSLAFVLGYVTAHIFLPRIGEVMPTVAAEPAASIPEPPAPEPVDTPVAATSPSISDQLETIDEVNDALDEYSTKYPVKLLETGEDGYEYSDVPAKNGETWLGLFEENGNYFVRSTNLKISKDADEMIAVDVSGANKPIFLVKNAPMIRSGPVTSVFRGIDNTLAAELDKRGVTLDQQSNQLNKNFNQTFKLGSATYVLRVSEARNNKGEKVWALFLYSGNARQLLQSVNQDYVSEMGYLYWIGDLDHDGRPDFYVELNDGDEAIETALFLSSKAEKGELVRKVAQYWFPGC